MLLRLSALLLSTPLLSSPLLSTPVHSCPLLSSLLSSLLFSPLFSSLLFSAPLRSTHSLNPTIPQSHNPRRARKLDPGMRGPCRFRPACTEARGFFSPLCCDVSASHPYLHLPEEAISKRSAPLLPPAPLEIEPGARKLKIPATLCVGLFEHVRHQSL